MSIISKEGIPQLRNSNWESWHADKYLALFEAVYDPLERDDYKRDYDRLLGSLTLILNRSPSFSPTFCPPFRPAPRRRSVRTQSIILPSQRETSWPSGKLSRKNLARAVYMPMRQLWLSSLISASNLQKLSSITWRHSPIPSSSWRRPDLRWKKVTQWLCSLIAWIRPPFDQR